MESTASNNRGSSGGAMWTSRLARKCSICSTSKWSDWSIIRKRASSRDEWQIAACRGSPRIAAPMQLRNSALGRSGTTSTCLHQLRRFSASSSAEGASVATSEISWRWASTRRKWYGRTRIKDGKYGSANRIFTATQVLPESAHGQQPAKAGLGSAKAANIRPTGGRRGLVERHGRIAG